jgi:hypothetical protein
LHTDKDERQMLDKREKQLIECQHQLITRNTELALALDHIAKDDAEIEWLNAELEKLQSAKGERLPDICGTCRGALPEAARNCDSGEACPHQAPLPTVESHAAPQANSDESVAGGGAPSSPAGAAPMKAQSAIRPIDVLEAAAHKVEKIGHDYMHEHGSYDPSTNVWEIHHRHAERIEALDDAVAAIRELQSQYVVGESRWLKVSSE